MNGNAMHKGPMPPPGVYDVTMMVRVEGIVTHGGVQAALQFARGVVSLRTDQLGGPVILTRVNGQRQEFNTPSSVRARHVVRERMAGMDRPMRDDELWPDADAPADDPKADALPPTEPGSFAEQENGEQPHPKLVVDV